MKHLLSLTAYMCSVSLLHLLVYQPSYPAGAVLTDLQQFLVENESLQAQSKQPYEVFGSSHQGVAVGEENQKMIENDIYGETQLGNFSAHEVKKKLPKNFFGTQKSRSFDGPLRFRKNRSSPTALGLLQWNSWHPFLGRCRCLCFSLATDPWVTSRARKRWRSQFLLEGGLKIMPGVPIK
eukprot:scaffold3208_cov107-Cylindrotheca_fusiformis.AAC.6